MRMRRARLTLGSLAVLALFALGSAAGATGVPGGADNETFQAWFVQLKTPPTSKGGSKGALAAERSAFLKNAADEALDVKQRLAFDGLWNGLSVDIPAEQAGSLATVPGVQ